MRRFRDLTFRILCQKDLLVPLPANYCFEGDRVRETLAHNLDLAHLRKDLSSDLQAVALLFPTVGLELVLRMS